MARVSERSVFNLPGLSPEGAVAPDLVRAGGLFFTSGVRGVDLASGRLPDDPAEQFLNAWHNLAALVSSAGLSLDNIGLVTNFIDSQEYRAHINQGWLEVFPSKSDRPARKTTSYPLPGGVGVELQAFGVIDQRRTCIEVPGLTHRDPLPNAARLGDYVFTSVIVPWDLRTSEPVIGEDAQTDQCFDNMRVVMEEAGGTIDDVVQCIGRIGAGNRSNHEIPGHGHHDPIPMGARIGDLYASSGVSGVDTAGPDKLEPVEGAAGQAHFGLRNVVTLAEQGGMSADDIGHITVLVQDHADVAHVDREWRAMFPDLGNRPARQVMQMGLQRRSRVQYHMLAAR